MKKLLIIAVLAAAPAEAKDYTLTLTDQEVQLIGVALGARPYSEVVNVVNKVQAQISAQNNPPPPPPPPTQQ